MSLSSNEMVTICLKNTVFLDTKVSNTLFLIVKTVMLFMLKYIIKNGKRKTIGELVQAVDTLAY